MLNVYAKNKGVCGGGGGVFFMQNKPLGIFQEVTYLVKGGWSLTKW